MLSQSFQQMLHKIKQIIVTAKSNLVTWWQDGKMSLIRQQLTNINTIINKVLHVSLAKGVITQLQGKTK